jgi:hypothetical protein
MLPQLNRGWGRRCKREAAGMSTGVNPIALRHAIRPQPACSLTSTRQRLLSSASHSTLIGGVLSRSGMAVFDRRTSMEGIGSCAADRAWALASPCSLLAPRPTGFSVADRSPPGVARETVADVECPGLSPVGRTWHNNLTDAHSAHPCQRETLDAQQCCQRCRARLLRHTISGSSPKLGSRTRWSSTIGLRPGFPPRFVQLSLYQLSPALVTSPVEISHHKLRDTGALPRPSLERVTQCSCGSLRSVAQQPGELPKQVLETKILLLWRELPL